MSAIQPLPGNGSGRTMELLNRIPPIDRAGEGSGLSRKRRRGKPDKSGESLRQKDRMDRCLLESVWHPPGKPPHRRGKPDNSLVKLSGIRQRTLATCCNVVMRPFIISPGIGDDDLVEIFVANDLV